MIRATLAAIFSFLLFLIVHVLDFHFLIPYEKTNSLLGAMLLGLLIFPVFFYLLPMEEVLQKKCHLSDRLMKRWVFPLLGVLFYGFLFLGYLEFYFTADRSITFRMLMLTDKQPSQTVTRENMFRLYDVPGIINKRFDDLTYGGYLAQQGDEYRLTEKGKLALNIYRFAIDYLRLDDGKRKNTVSKAFG